MGWWAGLIMFLIVTHAAVAVKAYLLGMRGPHTQELQDEGFLDVEPAIRRQNRHTWPWWVVRKGRHASTRRDRPVRQ